MKKPKNIKKPKQTKNGVAGWPRGWPATPILAKGLPSPSPSHKNPPRGILLQPSALPATPSIAGARRAAAPHTLPGSLQLSSSILRDLRRTTTTTVWRTDNFEESERLTTLRGWRLEREAGKSTEKLLSLRKRDLKLRRPERSWWLATPLANRPPHFLFVLVF
jgi:hypothetical protein